MFSEANTKKGVTFPQGFKAAGVKAGIKKSGNLDLALIYTEKEAAVAGTFTQNQVAAAPVFVSKEVVKGGKAHAVCANAGCANACTGDQGMANARAMAKAAAETLGIPQSHVMTKTRKKQRGESQYEKIESGATVEGTVQECGQLFKVNMSDYLDTGLFLDHRPLRQTVRQEAAGKSVLNLFCYTGSFSVYAAEGRARTVTSVDLSRTYIDWAKHNIALNEFNPDDGKKFIFHRGDVSGFLNQRLAEVPNAEGTNRFDIIVLDPPTFSNSKSTESTLDINRDWPELAGKCIRLLRKNGTLYFSTNSRRLQFDENLLPKETDDGAKIEVADMTAESIGEDFKNQKPHRLWRIRRLG